MGRVDVVRERVDIVRERVDVVKERVVGVLVVLMAVVARVGLSQV